MDHATALRIAELLLAHRAKREAEYCAAARVGLGPDLAAVAFDDGARDRQSHAHALCAWW